MWRFIQYDDISFSLVYRTLQLFGTTQFQGSPEWIKAGTERNRKSIAIGGKKDKSDTKWNFYNYFLRKWPWVSVFSALFCEAKIRSERNKGKMTSIVITFSLLKFFNPSFLTRLIMSIIFRNFDSFPLKQPLKPSFLYIFSDCKL